MHGHEYRDLIAAYIHANFAGDGLCVYTEVALGKTVIGKNRKLDLFVLREDEQKAIGLECKFQRVAGTADEKIPYALQDLEAMWIPGCLVYAGDGWSKGVLHTLEGSRLAVACCPDPSLKRGANTRELDHVLAAVFGLWSEIIPDRRKFTGEIQTRLPLKGPKRVDPEPAKKASSGDQ